MNTILISIMLFERNVVLSFTMMQNYIFIRFLIETENACIFFTDILNHT